MEDFAETNSKEVGDGWKVVQSRKAKPRRRRISQGSAGKESVSSCNGHSSNLESDPTSWNEEEELQLHAKIQKSKDRIQTSAFFKKFIEQMESLKILETLIANANNKGLCSDVTNGDSTSLNPKSSGQEGSNWASNTEKASQKVKEPSQPETIFKAELSLNVMDVGKPKSKSKHELEVVVLGVGSILDSEVSRCQLSLALLLQDRYDCIEKIAIYDPVLSRMECSVLTTLGCIPIVQDEKGRRPADSPTLFYMPHCGASLYNNLLEVNSNPWHLRWVCVLGNSFQKYQDSWSVFPKPKHQRPDCLLEVQKHVIEHAVDSASFPLLSAFNDMSWHLFPMESTLRRGLRLSQLMAKLLAGQYTVYLYEDWKVWPYPYTVAESTDAISTLRNLSHEFVDKGLIVPRELSVKMKVTGSILATNEDSIAQVCKCWRLLAGQKCGVFYPKSGNGIIAQTYLHH